MVLPPPSDQSIPVAIDQGMLQILPPTIPYHRRLELSEAYTVHH